MCSRHTSRATFVDPPHPASARSAHVDMGERTAAARVCVQAGASDQLRITGFDSLDGIEDHFYVRKVDLTVAVQVRHLAVPFLVDEHVSRITKLVTAVTRAALATNGEVVGGGGGSGA